jgi:23S rRNA (uracil1939-C5)-methyltransferase
VAEIPRYSGPFGVPQAERLLWRAGFGPRRGEAAALAKLGAGRVVYVSCDPATLARDAGILVHTKGLRLAAAGVVNMFPHTAHVESIALFER